MLMVYGANGYTGRLIAQLAGQRGERPVLAGRSAEKLEPLAREFGLEHRVVPLDDQDRLCEALGDIDAVVHCAGPFSVTSEPMVDACLATGTHYVDITGEIDVFERIFTRDGEAKRAGVVLLPGAGFDVVPTDGVAAILARELPDAVELELAFLAGGGMSPGTMKTTVEGITTGGRARVDGALVTVPVGHRSRVAEFASRPRRVGSVPWGDLSTAFRSTGIPTITTYTVVPEFAGKAQTLLAPMFRSTATREFAKRLAGFIPGPSERTRAGSRCEVWGQVRNAAGRQLSMTLTGPNPYLLTADSALRAGLKLIAGDAQPGSHTPSSAFGPDFVAELDGVTLSPVG
ncbi:MULTISPECIES: trans-acting enoyl reductase family protein [unclassified Kutzneria]|uniref:saccharopine dehydrogenase family protein n=1 Tax=unclassified Kutzneria TaxID=2621979 RepID=UPI0003EEBA98|nr:saccharopine dehydrogenase NADP-binding domain-containing protein [Kutzneria sp. 744]EWM12789.1 saccharopine dehydrogenase (NAD+, L-lysine forming) [Kutzneria sp. 744]